MRWPPNKAWTSTKKREGYRHFIVKNFGGNKLDRWVELSPANNKNVRFKVSWEELTTFSQWNSGWLQLPPDEDPKNKLF